MEKIVVRALIAASVEKAWLYYTLPQHITKWNFAHESWHCPWASNELIVGGKYVARMEAVDGSEGFDFEAVYEEIIPQQKLVYSFGERNASINFAASANQTEVVIAFDPETENPVEIQKEGWQAILNNFKKYVEKN